MKPFLPFLILLAPAMLSAAPLDVDGDGLSDVIGAEVQTDGSANEIAFIRLRSSDGVESRYEFGSHTEYAVSADYDGDGLLDYVVVGVQEDDTLLWRYRLSGSDFALTTESFGILGDKLLAGCDFDGDSKSDPALVREGTLVIDPSGGSSPVSHILPAESYTDIHCGDRDGDGIDEFWGYVFDKAELPKRSEVIVFDVNAETELERISIGRRVDRIAAADINGDGADDLVAARLRNGKSRKLFLIQDGTVTSQRYPTFIGFTRGGFISAGGDGLAIKSKRDERVTLVRQLASPATFENIELSRAEDLHLAVTAIEPQSSTSRETGCDQHLDPSDGVEGFVWKPVSDTTGNAVAVIQRTLRLGRVRAVKDGSILEEFYMTGIANNGRQTWRSRHRSGFFPDGFTLIGTQSGVNYCWLIPNPDRRYD